MGILDISADVVVLVVTGFFLCVCGVLVNFFFVLQIRIVYSS